MSLRYRSRSFFGGALLIMMGHSTRSASLFYYFRLEDHVPYSREIKWKRDTWAAGVFSKASFLYAHA
jgi:hypothetical protein